MLSTSKHVGCGFLRDHFHRTGQPQQETQRSYHRTYFSREIARGTGGTGHFLQKRAFTARPDRSLAEAATAKTGLLVQILLDNAALSAIRSWRFKPARNALGEAVSYSYTLPVPFRLR